MWRPIETAPKNGAKILALTTGNVPAIIEWAENEYPGQRPAWREYWQGLTLEQQDVDARYWVPIPDPPK